MSSIAVTRFAVRWVIYAIPAVVAVAAYRDPQTIDKLQFLIEQSGTWGMTFLLLATAMTPLRALACRAAKFFALPWGKRLSDWNFLIRERRALGLCAFYYAASHFAIYFYFEQAADLEWFVQNLKQRPFVLIGFVAFAMLVPLAATSFDRAVRLLGRRWKPLHRAVYLVVLLTAVHVVMLQKAASTDHWPYMIAISAIVTVRIYTYLKRGHYRHDDGFEAVRRRRPEAAVSAPESPSPPQVLA